MTILGIGGIANDPACAAVKDGRLVSAAEEAKIARREAAGELPAHAIDACLRIAGVDPKSVDCVALARPFGEVRSGFHLQLRERFPNSRLVVVDHHLAHAASAFYLSPFEEAAVLTLDRGRDFCCGAKWRGKGPRLQAEDEVYSPDSLGDLYGRVTALLGFRPGAEEHKAQWLSTYGDDRFHGVFDEIAGLRDGRPRIDQTFFDRDRPAAGGFGSKFYERLGLAAGAAIPENLRAPVAAGVQHALERAVFAMAGEPGTPLCLAGGLAMNVLLVAALERSRPVFVQPAAGNAGTAVGAALHAWHSVFLRKERVPLENLYLGPEFQPEEIKQVLENCKLRFRYLRTMDEVTALALEEILANRIVAWMHGRMEFGPRALGNRSILASPLNPYSTENLNLFIKHREPFRKFAASVPAELASEYFETGPNSRFLATVGRVRDQHKKTFASALLGGGEIRVHTVEQNDNPLYHRLLHEAGRKSGLPVLYNTSFNLFHDPLVCSPRDAARSFYSSGIDAMFVGSFFLQK